MARRRRTTLAIADLTEGDQIELGIFRAVVDSVDRDVPKNWPKGSAVLNCTYLDHRSVAPRLRGQEACPKACMLTDTVTAFR